MASVYLTINILIIIIVVIFYFLAILDVQMIYFRFKFFRGAPKKVVASRKNSNFVVHRKSSKNQKSRKPPKFELCHN